MVGKPLAIEIVGVAGSGKSTLTRALSADYGCRVADTLHTRLPAHWPYVTRSLPRVLPLLVTNVRNRPLLSWDELKFVMYVCAWDRYLRAELRGSSGAVVLDQGPIFALACLLWGGKPITRHPSFVAWVRRMAERWSRQLDAVVVLTAPDDVLLSRIDAREQRHDAKGVPAHAGLELLGRHAEAYRRVLELVEGYGQTRLFHYDTATMPASEIAGELAETLGLRRAHGLTETRPGRNVIEGSAATREDA